MYKLFIQYGSNTRRKENKYNFYIVGPLSSYAPNKTIFKLELL